MRLCKVFLIILPFASMAAGVLAAWVIDSGALRKWEPLDTPPGGATELVDANDTYVYVRNNSGILYRCPVCWEESPPLDRLLVDPDRPCPGAQANSPPPPGEVVDHLSGRVCYVDAWTDFEYVLLSDGSVWKWIRFSGFYGSLIYPVMAIIACMLGLIPPMLAILTSIFRKKSTAVSI
jgi:hypothetical protein